MARIDAEPTIARNRLGPMRGVLPSRLLAGGAPEAGAVPVAGTAAAEAELLPAGVATGACATVAVGAPASNSSCEVLMRVAFALAGAD